MTLKNSFIDLTDPTIYQSFGGDQYWERVEVPAGEMILKEGEGTQDFYYIFSGEVKVSKSLKDEAATQKHLADLHAGDFFGEGALLSDKGRSANVLAMQPVVLLKLPRERFEVLVKNDSEAAVALILGIVKTLNARMQNMNERLIVMHNLAILGARYAGEPAHIIPAIFKDLSAVLPDAEFALFGMDGLVRFKSLDLSEEDINNIQMKIPDYANKMAAEDSDPFIADEKLIYLAMHDLSGKLIAVLVVSNSHGFREQDIRFLVTIAEQIGHVLTIK